MKIALIAAMSENRVIGKDGKLPWNIPEEMKFFRDQTCGHTVIMGRKTFESMGKPLPKRENIIITRNPEFKVNGARTVGSLEEAFQKSLKTCSEKEEVFVTGGEEIYRLAMDHADLIYLTLIHREFEGDSYFPEIPEGIFREVSRDRREGPIPFTFFKYERVI